MDLARRQDGLLSRAQILSLGVNKGTVRRRIEQGGRWQVVLPGVYATFTGPLVHRQQLRAALLHAGDQAILSGQTAAELHGTRYVPPGDGCVHVLVPSINKVRSVAFVRMHTMIRLPRAWRLSSFPVVPPAHAAVDVARGLNNLRDVRAVMCEAVQRGLPRRTTSLGSCVRARPRGVFSRIRRFPTSLRAAAPRPNVSCVTWSKEQRAPGAAAEPGPAGTPAGSYQTPAAGGHADCGSRFD